MADAVLPSNIYCSIIAESSLILLIILSCFWFIDGAYNSSIDDLLYWPTVLSLVAKLVSVTSFSLKFNY